jgi:hypothetical protein
MLYTTCTAPLNYVATAGTTTADQVCAACTPPAMTTMNNQSIVGCVP